MPRAEEDGGGGGDETISVHLRLKPTKKVSGYLGVDDIDPTIVRVNIPERGVSREDGYVNNSKTQYSFRFNSVLPIEAKQEDVFNTVGRAAVTNVLDGINSTIFAYGQTGSGKTFTITGGVDSYDQRGIIPRAISMVFQRFASDPGSSYSCHISYLEIYNENGFDLLDPSHESKALEDLPRVTMMTDADGNAHLRNLSMHRANTEEEALNLLFLGDTNRAIAETPMNLASSRSHCLFTIFVEGRRQGTDTVRRAKLHLVDLAGSERAHKTGATGQTLREATYINTSLFYLEMVIVALHDKTTKSRTHIPYRNSMMTSVLRDSLGGNCKTVMVATVSVEAEQIEESISTCKFAQRVALIKNSAVVNEDLDPQLMIGRLKTEVHSLRDEVAFLKGEAGEGEALDPDELDRLHAAVEAYLGDTDPYATLSAGKLTLTKLKDAFAIFKNLVLEARNALAAARTEGVGAGGSGGAGAGTAAASGGGGGGSGSGGGGGGESVYGAEEVAMLREKLAQRDQEIAILVNMVKEAKRSARASTAGSSSSGGGGGRGDAKGGGGGRGDHAGPHTPSGGPAEAKEGGRDGRGGDGSGGGEAKRAPAVAPVRAPAPPPLVCGVALSASPELLGDAESAFAHFRDRWPRNAAIEANKATLKEKYDAAKQLYDSVMASRSNIGYLKKKIEQLRREDAMEREGITEAREGGGTGEEAEAMRAMEREKLAYAAACNSLRDEKAAIEHIQKLMTGARAKLQAEFDEWYGQCLHAEARHAVRGTGPQQPVSSQGTGVCSGGPVPPPSQTPGRSAHGHGGGGSQFGGSTAPPSSVASSGAHSAAGAASTSSHRPSSGLASASPKELGGGGLGATGNKEADDDIAAFQKAKEELFVLQRQQAQQRPRG